MTALRGSLHHLEIWVRDIAVASQGDDLVLATHGRGIWIIDDISPLRALSPAVAASDVTLMRSEPVQQRISGNGGTAVPCRGDPCTKAPVAAQIKAAIVAAQKRLPKRLRYPRIAPAMGAAMGHGGGRYAKPVAQQGQHAGGQSGGIIRKICRTERLSRLCHPKRLPFRAARLGAVLGNP